MVGIKIIIIRVCGVGPLWNPTRKNETAGTKFEITVGSWYTWFEIADLCQCGPTLMLSVQLNGIR